MGLIDLLLPLWVLLSMLGSDYGFAPEHIEDRYVIQRAGYGEPITPGGGELAGAACWPGAQWHSSCADVPVNTAVIYSPHPDDFEHLVVHEVAHLAWPELPEEAVIAYACSVVWAPGRCQ